MKLVSLIVTALLLGACSNKPYTSEVAPKQAAINQGDIVDIASTNGSFNTLVTAIKAAGLVETLKSPGPFTVFAPTDAAFAKLPEGTLESLLADPDKLKTILTYHVVSGKVMAQDVTGLSSATTVQGGTLPINTTNGVRVGEASVVTTDVMASNGVIHVIDTVLLPSEG